MKSRNIKAIFLAGILSIPCLSTGSSNYKLNNVSKAGAANIIFNDSDEIEENVSTTSISSTSFFNTTTSTVTTTVATTEVVDQYKDIRQFEKLKNNNLSIEEIDLFIKRYSEFSKLSYDEALDVLNNNIESIENDYVSIRGGIMCSLFSYSNENGYLKVHTEDREIRENMTQEDKEYLIIEFCDNLGLSYDDICIVIAAFREETGNGTSYKCVNDNNYGGIRIYGEEGCNGEYGMYSTPEFGIYRHVKCVSNKLIDIRNQEINDLESVVYNFAYRYNRDYASQYSNKILNWVYNVQDDYESFDYGSLQKRYIK